MGMKRDPSFSNLLSVSTAVTAFSRKFGSPKYLPLQVEEGDYVIFLRKSAIEIEFELKKYLIVPQSAILLIVRNDIVSRLSDEDST